MKRVVYLNEERLYQLVEQVLLETIGFRKPIPGFKWDFSNGDMYTLVSLKPLAETNLSDLLKPLVDYFIGVMHNKIRQYISKTDKTAAIVILFPQDNIKMTIRFYFTYEITFNINGRNRTINTIRNVRIKSGGAEIFAYKNDKLDSTMFNRDRRAWAQKLVDLVQANLGRLEK